MESNNATLAESRSKAIIHSITGMHYDSNPEFVLRVARDLAAALTDAINILDVNTLNRKRIEEHLVELTDEEKQRVAMRNLTITDTETGRVLRVRQPGE